MVIATTAAAVAVSLYLPKTYKAASKVVFLPNTTAFSPTDDATIQRTLQTFQRLLATRDGFCDGCAEGSRGD